jgi:hypothetical protein
MDKDILTKTGVALKQLDEAGRGLARIATLSAVDHDGDTYAPGAFAAADGAEQFVVVRDSHSRQGVSLGKARLYEEGDEALAAFALNLDTEAGREWHAALKFDLDAERSGGAPLQEWSYGFRILDAVQETRDGERVRVLKKLKVHEISPVVVGAGIGTATLALKSGLPFGQQIEAAIAALDDIAERAEDLAKLRAGDGRTLSKERLDRLALLTGKIGRVVAAGRADSEEAGRLAAGFARFQTRRHL